MKGVIFTYALTFGGAFISFFDPATGIIVYILLAIIKPDALWAWAIPQGGTSSSRIVALALLAGWIVHGFGRWDLGRARGIVAAFIVFVGCAVLSAARAPDQEVAWHFVEEILKILLPFLVAITTIRSVGQLKRIIWVIVLSEGYLALEFNRAYLSGFNIIKEIGFAGMEEGSVAIGMVSVLGLAFFLGLSEKIWWRRLICFGAAALMGHVVLFSFSRGGMLSLIVSGIVALLVIPKRLKHFFPLLLTALLFLRLAGPEVRERFFTIFAGSEHRDQSSQSRLDLWANCWDSMLKRPFLGVGPDHFPLIAKEYGWPSGKEAHSLWMQIGAELGFPGLIALASFYGLCVVRLWPLARGRSAVSDPWLQSGARMVVVSIAGFAVAAQFISIEGLEIPYYITLAGAGMLKLNSREDRGFSSTRNGKIAR